MVPAQAEAFGRMSPPGRGLPRRPVAPIGGGLRVSDRMYEEGGEVKKYKKGRKVKK